MSLNYDFAIACDLRADLPVPALAALRYLARALPDAPDDADLDVAILARLRPDGATAYAPGEFGCTMREVARPAESSGWTFGLRRFLHDDAFHEVWWAFALWLAALSATEGLVGYYREELDVQPTLLYFRAGHLYLHEVTGTPESIGEGTPPFGSLRVHRGLSDSPSG